MTIAILAWLTIVGNLMKFLVDIMMTAASDRENNTKKVLSMI